MSHLPASLTEHCPVRLDLSEKDRRRAVEDLGPALLALAERRAIPPGPLNDLQLALKKSFPDARGVVVPFELLRTMTASTFGSGGFLVPTALADSVSPVPRPRRVLEGATWWEGLSANLSLPRGTACGNLQWLFEGESAPDTDLSGAPLVLIPHRVAGTFSLTSQLFRQAPMRAGKWISAEIKNACMSALEQAALSGDGAHGSPLGLLYQPNTTPITFGGAATLSKVASFETAVANTLGDDLSAVYITTPNVREKWRTIARFSGGGLALWEGLQDVLGHVGHATTNILNERVVCGAVDSLQVGVFGAGVDVLVDPFTGKAAEKIKFHVNLYGDCGPLRPAQWAVSQDAGNQ